MFAWAAYFYSCRVFSSLFCSVISLSLSLTLSLSLSLSLSLPPSCASLFLPLPLSLFSLSLSLSLSLCLFSTRKLFPGLCAKFYSELLHFSSAKVALPVPWTLIGSHTIHHFDNLVVGFVFSIISSLFILNGILVCSFFLQMRLQQFLQIAKFFTQRLRR